MPDHSHMSPPNRKRRREIEQAHKESMGVAEQIATGPATKTQAESSSRFLQDDIQPIPYRFRGAYAPPAYRKGSGRPSASTATSDTVRQLVQALQKPGVEIPIYRYMANPGFGLAGQAVLQAFDQFDPSRPFMAIDTEWLGRGEAGFFAPTEIALSFVRGDDIQVASTLIAPDADQKRHLVALIEKARAGKRLNADEWRSLRDLMLYSRSPHLNMPGAQLGPFGHISAHASWVRELPQGADLRPYLRYAEEGLETLERHGRSLSEAAQWFEQVAADRIARGVPVVSWNGIRADFPVLLDAFGSDSRVARILSQANHVDLLATIHTVSTDPLELLERVLGRPLTTAEIQSMSGYLQQESIASLLGIEQQAHIAGSDVNVLSRITQRFAPVLKSLQARARVEGAGAIELPGRQVYDPRPIKPGQLIYAMRGGTATYSELYEGGQVVADPYAYRGVRSNYTYRVQAIRPFESEGRTLYGVSLQPIESPHRTLFLGFDTEEELYRFFQGFTPAPNDPEAIARSRQFAIEDAARRRYAGFTDPRYGSAYGFEAAKRYYKAAVEIEDLAKVSDEDLRLKYGFTSEAQIRDFKTLYARLRSEAGRSDKGLPTGVLRAIEAIESALPGEEKATQRTLALASFMRQVNEAAGFTWEGPLTEVELPLSRRVGLELRIPGLDGTREINLMQPNSAVASLRRILSETAQHITGSDGEQALQRALHQQLLPAIQEAGVRFTDQEMQRIMRHRLIHEQVRELAHVLISRDLTLERQTRLMPWIGPRAFHDDKGQILFDFLRKAPDPKGEPDQIDEMIAKAIHEAGELSRLPLPKPGDPIAFEPGIAKIFREMDAAMRAPFSDEVSARFRSSQDVVVDLMRELHRHGIHSHLITDDAGRLFLGVTTAEHADEVFSTIYRRGWANRDRTRVAWLELPAIEHGGYTTGGRLSRPVADVVFQPGGGERYVLKSRFEHALDIDPYTLRNMALALEEGSTLEAERLFRRAVNKRLEQAPWTQMPWDDPLWDKNQFSLNLAAHFRTMKVETTERLVRHLAADHPEVVELGGLEPNADLMRLPRRLKLAVEKAVQERAPRAIFGSEDFGYADMQLSTVKAEDISKYRWGLPEGDAARLMPWGGHLDISRAAPRQAWATTPILPERLDELIRAGSPEIVPGSLVTTASRRALEEKLQVPISSTTVRAAIVGREDILDAMEAAVRSGRITRDELDQIIASSFLTTSDEQIIVSPRLARVHALREDFTMRLDPDAVLSPRIQAALDAHGNLKSDTEVVFGFDDVVAEYKRQGKTELIRMDQRNAQAILQGVRRDERTQELIVRFQLQREMEQGSRARVGTHKGVIVENPYLQKLFPGIDVLYYGKFQRRGQLGELAAGLIAKTAMPHAFDRRSRDRFLRELVEETGIEAQWVRAPQRDGVLSWQLQLPEDGDIPMERILQFVEKRGGVTEELYPGGPRVLTVLADFARLEQEERVLKNRSGVDVLRTGKGINIGPREQDVLRRHGLEEINRWIRSFSDVVGKRTTTDPEQAWAAIRAVAGQGELPVRNLSEFERPLPIKAIEGGYRPEDIIGTIFDPNVTGKEAFWLDLNLQGYEQATGRKARVAVVPEELLQVRDERYLGELNKRLRSVIETAQEISTFHLKTASEVELLKDVKLEDLYERLTQNINEYREAVRASVADYDSIVRDVVPGSWGRLHVIDSAVDRIAPGTVEVARGYFQEMGIDPENPYALFARFPTDPGSIQVVRLVESDRVGYGQIAVPEILGHAVGGDTDSDTAILFGMNAPLKAQLERAGIGPDDPLYADAERLDRLYRREVLPKLKQLHEAQLAGARPLGVISDEAFEALKSMGGYEQMIEDPQTGQLRPMTPGERIRAILGDESVIRALHTSEEVAERNASVLHARQSASVIGTISNEVQRRLALADFVWQHDPEMGEDMAKLADFLDILKEKGISAQKHEMGEMDPRLISKYGDQLSLAIREALRGAQFDDLEEMLVALGKDAKTQRDLTREFVKEHVDILRRLHEQAGSYWNHPFLEVGLRGAGRITEEQLLLTSGPITPAVQEMLSWVGHTYEDIQAAETASRIYMTQQAAMGATSSEVERFVREGAQRAGERSMRAITEGSLINASLKGAGVMGAVMAAAWLLPKAVGGPTADLSRPDKEEAGLSPQLQQLMLPGGQVPNVQPTQPPLLQSGLNVKVQARSPGNIMAEEIAALIEQAVASATQMRLDVTTRIMDERTVIDRAWIQSQVAAALG